MLKKLGVNVVWCVAFLLVSGLLGNGSIFAQGGVDSYTKLMLHADGSDQGTAFTDSSSGAKTINNAETYDSYTKLMLHMDGSGNYFTDSATSKAVTANGNVNQTAAQFKFDSRTAVFDGSGDYLSLADSDDWNFGSGDFTIDFLVMFSSVSGQRMLLSQWNEASNSRSFFVNYNGDDKTLQFRYSSNGTDSPGDDFSWSPVVNVLYHVAIVRSTSSVKAFIDGVQIGSTYNISTDVVNNSTASFFVGTYTVTIPQYFFEGWIEELRISKGIARWTSNFTPPSSPYGNVYTITGTKKFGTASGEFKGNGEYLSLADSADWDFSGDFALDFWTKFNSTSGWQHFVTQRADANNSIDFTKDSGGRFKMSFNTGGTDRGNLITTSAVSITTGVWYHVAFVRSGSNAYIFLDGVSQALTTNTTLGTVGDVAAQLAIGIQSGSAGEDFNGWMDEIRFSKGIARWTSNFTTPSAPYETDTTAPTVSTTSPASSATGVGVSSAISATFSEDMDSSTITTTTFTLSSSSGSSVSGTVSYSNKVATFTPSSNLSYSTTYTATITTGVKDISGNAMSSNYTWSFTTGSAPDTTAPSGSISINSGASYTNSTTVTLTLSAADSVGVTGYYLSDSSTTPSTSASGWTSVTSATSYSGSVSYTLSSGEGSKTIYAWYKDAAGNVSSTASDTITLDTTAPTVSITSPTTSTTYTATSSTITLSGSASDSTSGISAVSWSNSKGGSGTASGTASWTISSISLSSGDNVITVTAKDGAGNSGTDTLQVTYGTGTTVSVPTASTGSASSVTTSSATLNGTVNANGASTTAWFQYGSTSGSYGNTSSTQTVTGSSNTTVSIGISGLSSNTKYYYRIAASNSGGTSYGSESSFTTSTATATPTPTPTPSTGDSSAPTDGSITINSGAYTNSTGVTLTLSAKDNIGVTGYYLSQNSSTPSSSASGWTSVSSSTNYSGSVSYTVSGGEGSKTVYVWFKDSSGNVSNAASDDITIDTISPSITITSPTSDAAYTSTSSTISLGGSASDGASGVKEVTWSNSSGGSGTASGTASWTVSNISLSNGDNTITVISTDNAGNTAADTITVTYKSTSANIPKASTWPATNVTETSATLNGTVNANGLTTTAWFYYGANSGLYTGTSSTQAITGSSDTTVSISISGLTAGTKYYYKLSAQNSAGTSVGSEALFTTKTVSATPTPGVTPLPTLPPLPTPQPSPSPANEGIVFGIVNDPDAIPLKGVSVTIVGANVRSPSENSTETDEYGYYQFDGLSGGEYSLSYEKEGFLSQTNDISLKEGEVKDLGTIVMEQVEAEKIYGYVVNIKGSPIEYARLRLKGLKTKKTDATATDADGFFEFTDLETDTYVIFAKRKGYKKTQQKVALEEGESKEIEIIMKKTSKRIKGLFIMEDIQ